MRTESGKVYTNELRWILVKVEQGIDLMDSRQDWQKMEPMVILKAVWLKVVHMNLAIFNGQLADS